MMEKKKVTLYLFLSNNRDTSPLPPLFIFALARNRLYKVPKIDCKR